MDKKFYPVSKMPAVSVIVVFYNEARSTLLRTAWSVIDRTEPSLLKELILVDDGSDREHLKEALDRDVADMPKTRVVRLKERSGLIRAKVHGVEASSGEILAFIDSHCEVNDGWLAPMIDRIVRNRRTIAMPIVDVIDMDTFEVKQAIVEKGVFSWSLYFYWLAPRGHVMEPHYDRYGIDILSCPVMAGGLFAIDRDYFYEIGAYDMGQDTWGGENIEMSFRVWMCGGKLEIVPCSRVSHVFRSQSPYKFKDRDPGRTIAHNLNRVAEVWMDEYADIYYNITNNRRFGYGDVAERKELRRTHKCKSFRWYMENVAPYQFAPLNENRLASGQLKLVSSSMCLGTDGTTASARACRTYAGHTMEWSFTKKPFQGQIRHEHAGGSRCLYAHDTRVSTRPRVHLGVCFDHEKGGSELLWEYGAVAERPRAMTPKGHSNACLTLQRNAIVLSSCTTNDANQEWEWYNPK